MTCGLCIICNVGTMFIVQTSQHKFVYFVVKEVKREAVRSQ